MIVTRAKFIQAMKRQKPDRVGLYEPTMEDATAIATYAQRILPLAVQGEALFWENGGRVETPKQATLALALHQAEPEMFAFPDCQCGEGLQDKGCTFKPDEMCGRKVWLELLRERAHMPATVETPPIPIPKRGKR